MSSEETTPHADEELAYGGVCPVCGDEFTDGFDDLEEGQSREDVRVCVVELENGEAEALFHLPEDQEKSPVERWEEHNDSFQYDAPEKPADAWSSDEYEELHDRVIRRQVQWMCTECTGRGPMSSLKKARSHVSSQHSPDLVEQHAPDRDELDVETDGGTDTTETRESENHGLPEFDGGEDSE